MESLRWKLDPSVVDHVAAHAVEVHGATVRDTGSAWARLGEEARELAGRWKGTLIGDVDGIRDARRLYQVFGVDPTRTRPSSEALLRRALKGQEFYRINEAVDVGNWVSLEYLLPLGLYDRDRIEGAGATVRTGREGEEYAGIRKGPVHLGGRLCVADAAGAFGSPTSDSRRTRVRESTTRLAAIVFAPRDIDPARLRGAGRALAARLAAHCEARVVYEGPVEP